MKLDGWDGERVLSWFFGVAIAVATILFGGLLFFQMLHAVLVEWRLVS